MPNAQIEDRKDTGGTPFPSDFIDPGVKRTSSNYFLKYAQAFHSETNFAPTDSGLLRNNRNYTRYRQYGRGEQSPDQYKELAGLKKEKGKLDTSFRNLNFDILKVVPKMRSVLINRIVNNNYNLTVKPIDATGFNERLTRKSKITEFIINQEYIKAFEELTKIGLEKPIEPGEEMPQNLNEIDPYLDQNPKDSLSMEVKDYLTWVFAYNDWAQLGEEMAGDLVDLGVAGTRPWVDGNGLVRIRRIIPERCIVNKCIYPDFRDMIRFGEYYEITISDYRKMTGGKLGEDHYRKIANEFTGGRGKYKDFNTNFYNETSYSYAYDHERLTVVDMMWYSTDTEVHVEITNSSGNRRVKKKDYNYVPFKGDTSVNGGKGLSDEEYKAQTGKSVYREEIKNVYKTSWIVGSETVYNYGLMENMPRTITNWNDTKLPVTLLTLDFMSPIGNIEPLADEVQMNFLQFQSHINSSKPPGVAIERKALARLRKGGKGGLGWDPKEDLMMFAESGNIVFDGYDQHGNPLPYMPIMPLQNGLSPAAGEHWGIMLGLIDLMRNTLGLNPLTEGQAPPERLGKYVAQLSFTASDNALAHMIAAYRKLFERTGQMAYYMMQSAITATNDSTSEALGLESYRYLQLNKDIGLRDMGILIEEGPDVHLREKISGLLLKSVDAGEISGEDAIEIEREENLYRSVTIMRKRKRERQELAQREKKEIIETQNKSQADSTVYIEQEKAKIRQAEIDKEKELLIIKHNLQKETQAQEFLQNLILKKIDNQQSADEHETDFIKSLILQYTQNKSDQALASNKESQPINNQAL
jgi:hypothetical protein